MAEDFLRHGQIGAHQESRPVHGVEPDNILPDQVHAGGPEFAPFLGVCRITEPGDVVGQRIDPDIHYVLVTARHLYAPVEAGAADRKISEALRNEGYHLVPPAFGFEKARPVEQFEQSVLIIGETEEPAFLDSPFDRRALRRKAVAVLALGQLALVVIRFVADGIPALVTVEIEIAFGFHRAPDRLAGGMMIRFDSADETIVRDIENVIHRPEIAGHFVRQFARRAALLFGLARHLQAVFVGAGLEPHLATLEALEARDDIGGDRFVSVADMGATIGIIDRGGDIEGLRHWRVR